jgi:hypothetical protein
MRENGVYHGDTFTLKLVDEILKQEKVGQTIQFQMFLFLKAIIVEIGVYDAKTSQLRNMAIPWDKF